MAQTLNAIASVLEGATIDEVEEADGETLVLRLSSGVKFRVTGFYSDHTLRFTVQRPGEWTEIE